MESNKIRFAVVGYGNIGRKHVGIIEQHPETELVAICDKKPKEFLNLNGGVPFYESLNSLLYEGPPFDVLSIATPNGIHVSQAIAGIDAKRHVLIEKPMGLNRHECEKIIYKAFQANKYVFCVMQNRYSPPAQWIKSIIDNGKLGKIFFVQINCYWNRGDRYYQDGDWRGTLKLDGGPLFTQFSHFIDMMYWLFGDVRNIQARFSNFNHSHTTEFEDSGIVSFEFLNGGMGCMNYTTSVWDKNMESSLTVVAENGSVKIAGQYMNEIEYCHVKDYTLPILPPSNPPNDYTYYKGSAANHQYVIENVVDVLKGRTSISTNALEGYKVVHIIEQIYSLRKETSQSHVPEKSYLYTESLENKS